MQIRRIKGRSFQVWVALTLSLFLCRCLSYEPPIEDVKPAEEKTASEPKKKDPVVEYHQIEKVEVEALTKPLPAAVPYLLTSHYDDGHDETTIAYRGWDFDRDGRIDMLEILNADGEATTSAFDFTGDGKVDFVKHQKP